MLKPLLHGLHLGPNNLNDLLNLDKLGFTYELQLLSYLTRELS